MRGLDQAVARSVTNVSNVSYVLSTHGQTDPTTAFGDSASSIWANSSLTLGLSRVGLERSQLQSWRCHISLDQGTTANIVAEAQVVQVARLAS